MTKKFNLRWLSLSKTPYLVQWSFRRVVPEPVEGLNDRYSHYFLGDPFFMLNLFAVILAFYDIWSLYTFVFFEEKILERMNIQSICVPAPDFFWIDGVE